MFEDHELDRHMKHVWKNWRKEDKKALQDGVYPWRITHEMSPRGFKPTSTFVNRVGSIPLDCLPSKTVNPLHEEVIKTCFGQNKSRRHSISKYIDLNAKDYLGCTAFHRACQLGHTEIIKLLLNHQGHIDLNAKDNHGMTGFMLACEEGENDVVKLILDHPRNRDIDFNARDTDGRAALIQISMHALENTKMLSICILSSEGNIDKD